MSNKYYLVTSDKVDQAQALSPAIGFPNRLFQFCISPDGTLAIIQADWMDDLAIAKLGTCLGDLQSDGSASQGVYDELAKPEWQPAE